MSATETKNKNSVKNSVNDTESTGERPQNKHLKPFAPGQSGNPTGRPLGRRNKETMFELALEGYARKLLTKYNKSHKKQIDWEDFDGDPELDIFMQLVDKARNGDLKAIEAFLEHRHGKAKATVAFVDESDDPEFIAEMENAKQDASKFFTRFGVKVEVTVKEKKPKAEKK